MNRILSSGAGAATNDHSGADEMLLQKCKMRRIDQMKQHLAQQPMPFALLMFLLRIPESLQDRKFLHVLSQLIAHNTSYAADCAHTLRLNHHLFTGFQRTHHTQLHLHGDPPHASLHLAPANTALQCRDGGCARWSNMETSAEVAE